MVPFIFGVIYISLACYAALQVITSDETIANKTVWALLIYIAPFVGFIIWVVSGPRTKKTA